MQPISRKVLILDDCLTDREMCRRFLARAAPEGTYQCLEHCSLKGACDAVRAAAPHCVLLDYHLQDGTGIEFLQQIEISGEAPGFAVVMLTGTGSEAIAVESIQNGAHAYMLKDSLSPARLHDAVEGAMLLKQGLDLRNRRTGNLLRHLREENERLSRILSMLPHELRTSLTPIFIAAGVLRDQPKTSGEVREIAAVILKNAETQARLIDARLEPVIPRPYGQEY